MKKKTILVILIAGIGDLILSSKSVRSIRNGFPDADIHLLTSTDAGNLAQNYDYINHVWVFPMRELRKNKKHIFGIIKLISNLRKIQFDTIVNLYRIGSWQGSVKMGILFLLLKSKERIGHNHKGFGVFIGKKLPKEGFINRHFVDAMLDIACIAGGKPDDKGIEVFWSKNCEKKWEYLFEQKNNKLNELKVGINPGGDRQDKRWNPNNFAFVADYLKEHFDLTIILMGGPGEEVIAHYIQHNMANDCINLAGKLTLDDLTYIISQMDLLITNDSGPMHIAAAVKTPLVAIFGPENPKLFGPYTAPEFYRILHKGGPDCPAGGKKLKRLTSLDLIKPEDVISASAELLENRCCH